MDLFFILPHYARWHYSRGIRDLFRNIRSFLFFLAEFFSLGILFRTLFSPWERMGEEYDKGFRPGKIAETFVLNVILRFFGFFVRATVLLLGFVAIVCGIFLGIILIALWVLAPIFILFLIALGIKNLLLA